jgi:hypothetical protein
VTLSNAVTGTGNMVLSASPTLTGTLTAAAANFSGAVTVASGATQLATKFSSTNAGGVYSAWTNTSTDVGYAGSAKIVLTSSFNLGDFAISSSGGNLYLNTASTSIFKTVGNTTVSTQTASLFTLATALNYGGVTLSNSVTGTGNMVLSASPTLTGTLTGAAANFSGTVTATATTTATNGTFTISNSGGNYGYWKQNGSTYAGTGIDAASSSVLYAWNGLSILNANGPILFAASGTTEGMRFSSAGLGIGMTPSNILDITQNQNAGSVIKLLNNSAGANAQALVQLSDGTNNAYMAFFGTGGAGTGPNNPGSFSIQTQATGGMNIATTAAYPIKFHINNTEIARFETAGNFKLSSGTKVLNSSGNPILNQTGSVLQVVSTTKTDTFSTSSTSAVDVTGLSVSITPSSANSKIFVTGSVCFSEDSTIPYLMGFLLVRNSTSICIADSAGSRSRWTFGTQGVYTTDGTIFAPINYLDSPATTSATTYKIQVQCESPRTIYINRGGESDGDNSITGRFTSTITVMEISG